MFNIQSHKSTHMNGYSISCTQIGSDIHERTVSFIQNLKRKMYNALHNIINSCDNTLYDRSTNLVNKLTYYK